MRVIVGEYSDGVLIELVEEGERVVLRIGKKRYGPGARVGRVSGIPLHPHLAPFLDTGRVVEEWMRRRECTEAERAFANRFLDPSRTRGRANG